MGHRVVGSVVAVTLAALGAQVSLGAGAAVASPTSGPAAVVTMGDSYISGEAGRWEGNSTDPAPGHDGTDRTDGTNTSKVYVGGSDSGQDTCHRSDVSELAGADVGAGVEKVNIACSGAVTSDLLTTAQGGTSDHTEAPEGDQLAQVAAAKDVKAIVVSIGGNDFGFADIIVACTSAYSSGSGPCAPSQQPMLESKRADVTTKIENVVDSIRGVMAGAGYAAGSYRLILQNYAVVAAPGDDIRYPEQAGPAGATGDRSVHGCPNYTSDATWFSTTAAPIIGDAVRAAATAKQTEFLDLSKAFVGHEGCSTHDQAVDASHPPSPTTSEWGRAFGPQFIAQGSVQEVVHPNAFGQRALSTCLSGVLADGAGTFACTGAAGLSPTQLTLRQTSAFAGPLSGSTTPMTGGSTKSQARKLPLKLAVLTRSRRRGGVVCVTLKASAGRMGVGGVHLRLGRYAKTTAANGHARICARFTTARLTARASKRGYTAARTRHVTVPRRR